MSMSAAAFERCLKADPDLLAQCLEYAQAVISTVSQYAACNRLHPVIERCARWLLMAHDRVPDDTILLTHQFLSQMLGVRRAGVSVAASTLQRAGYIEYEHGRIQVRDRAGLESASCECYSIVEHEWLHTMDYSVSKTPFECGTKAARLDGRVTAGHGVGKRVGESRTGD
jgi:hypothetical protein